MALTTGLDLDKFYEEENEIPKIKFKEKSSELFKNYSEDDSTFEVNHFPQNFSHNAPDFVDRFF